MNENESADAILIKNIQDDMTEFINCVETIKSFSSNDAFIQNLITILKRLRNSCCKGYIAQCEIIKIVPIIFTFVENNGFTSFEHIPWDKNKQVSLIVWQLIANIVVNNVTTQQTVWDNYGTIIKELLNEITLYTDVQLLIVYNIVKGQSVFIDPKEVFSILLKIWSNVLEFRHDKDLEFLHIFFEEFLCNISCRIVPIYALLEPQQRVVALKYIASYIRSGSPNGQIQKILMEFISKEFKKKSDCILRVNDERLNEIVPYEVLTLIEVISIATGDILYLHIYENDHSLFLNVGGLLYTINEIGKKSNNVFSPMEKLTEVAPSSKINPKFENEISFQLRTFLVRTLANLLYKNRKNQEYVRELNIIAAILDSTRVDARNPLIREWSILAIRNLCENCPENQQVIYNLSKVDEAPNDVLTELNLEMGSLRISPKK